MRNRVRHQSRTKNTNRVGAKLRVVAERANRRATSRALSTHDWEGVAHVARPERVVVTLR